MSSKALPLRKAKAYKAHIGFRDAEDKKMRLERLRSMSIDTQELLRQALEMALSRAEKALKLS